MAAKGAVELIRACIGVFVALLLMCVDAHAVQVGYAGFAYAGDFQSIQSRFRFVSRIVPPHAAQQSASPSAVERQLLDAVRNAKPKTFEVVADSLAAMEDGDQVIMTALVATGETVSLEKVATFTKVFIDLRAQVLIFDFKSMKVLRAYPISVIYIGAPTISPTDAELLEKVRQLIVGDRQTGLVGHFISRLQEASLPDATTHYLGVTDVLISDQARTVLPNILGPTGVAQTWIADRFAQALVDHVGVSMVPYTKGYAIGQVMSMHVADGTVFDLKLPPVDFSVELNVTALKKIKYAEAPAGTSYIYGAFVHLLVQEPLSQRHYFDALVKNGETKVVPATQAGIDDWAAFEESIAGLFGKLSATFSGDDTNWIRSAVIAPDLTKQIESTQTVLRSCK